MPTSKSQKKIAVSVGFFVTGLAALVLVTLYYFVFSHRCKLTPVAVDQKYLNGLFTFDTSLVSEFPQPATGINEAKSCGKNTLYQKSSGFIRFDNHGQTDEPKSTYRLLSTVKKQLFGFDSGLKTADLFFQKSDGTIWIVDVNAISANTSCSDSKDIPSEKEQLFFKKSDNAPNAPTLLFAESSSTTFKPIYANDFLTPDVVSPYCPY